MFLEALGVGVPLNELVQAMVRKPEQSLEVINSFQLEVWAIYAVLFLYTKSFLWLPVYPPLRGK